VQSPDRRRVLAALPALAWPAWSPALAASPGPTVLSVEGAIRRANGERAAHFDMALLEQMAQHRIKTPTPWHSGEPEFSGPLLRDVLAAAGAEGPTLRMWALNDYRVDIPTEDAQRLDVIVARLVDQRPIAVRDKGPLFVMYPFDRHPELRNSLYLSRCIWQLRRIEVR